MDSRVVCMCGHTRVGHEFALPLGFGGACEHCECPGFNARPGVKLHGVPSLDANVYQPPIAKPRAP